MGSFVSKKRRRPCGDDPEGLSERLKILQNEVKETRFKRDKEIRAYEQQARVFIVKEAEWKRERRRLREEVRRLRKRLKEKEERIRVMEDAMVVGGKSEKEWQLLGTATNFLVEHMREEQARRDEAVEKWKTLYLAIKTELDDLIQRTHGGERLYLGVEVDCMMEGVQKDLTDKAEAIEVLKARLSTLEQEKANREREVTILRQSLRIMSSKKKKKFGFKKGLARSLHL